ncbi:MAG: DUF308 domain-containing protein [Deinococcales bacterium]
MTTQRQYQVQDQAIANFLADKWWLVLLRAIVGILFGLMLLFRPGQTLVAIVQVLGIYWLVDGALSIYEAIMGKDEEPSWGWSLLGGLLSLVAGIIVLARPLLATVVTTSFFLSLVAIVSIVIGIIGIIRAIQVRKEIDNELSIILLGILQVLFGMALLANPVMSVAILLWTLAISSIVIGVSTLMAAFKLRSLKQVA